MRLGQSVARDVAFAVAFLVAGLGASALLWSVDRLHFRAFAGMALQDTEFVVEGRRRLTLDDVLRVDDGTRAYVLCECAEVALLERIPGFYNEREKAHLQDVQRVLAGTKRVTLGASALLVAAGLGLSRERLRRAVRVDATVIVAAGALAAVLFEPAFLLFHRVFFPQGNFLFDPSSENLVRLYPQTYWLTATLLVGATVVLLALLVAALSGLPIRSGAVARSSQEEKRVE